MKPKFLQETEKLNIQPERCMTLKFLAMPPRHAWRMRLTESSLRRTAERPKLATRWKFEGERGVGGLTEHPNHCETRAANLIPGSKQRFESPAMDAEEDQRRTSSEKEGGGTRWGGAPASTFFLFLTYLFDL